MLVLRGRNGGGKTTLLKVLAGLLAPMQGEVWRREGLTVGYLPQYRTIDREFPLTVFDTVRSGLQCTLKWWQHYNKYHRELTQTTLRTLGLEALADCPIRNLSGGQWQRTLLARALVSQPQLLLLDEPDTHLDNASKRELYTTLLREHTRRTIVLVSHDEHLKLPPEAQIIDLG
jgi:iron chelate ABC transporter, ATP-binding protein